MQWITDSTILIVGLGLMGGSYAKGLKRLGYKVAAIDTNRESIQYALDNEIIDVGSCEADPEIIKSADTIIFALYPKTFVKWIEQNQQHFKSDIRITDVTGVKSDVVEAVQSILREDVEFIAAHPMAGREVSGVQNSDERIFHNANYIVVPTSKNTKEAIEWCEKLGKLLGFKRISVLSPKEHDQMIGYVSQLTHCIAVALMTCNDNEHLVDYTGDSFRDLTRIAKINDEMWSELFFMNEEILTEEIDDFIAELTAIKQMIKDGDSDNLREKMRLSTRRRKLFDK